MLTTAPLSALALLQPSLVSAATLRPLYEKTTTPSNATTAAVNTTTCAGNTYTYRALAGYGFVPGTARDKHGDTLGGLGSSIAIEHGSWKLQPTDNNGTALYTGVLWALPDRGWNTNGTLNFTPRVHKLAVSFAPAEAAATKPNLQLEYLDTVLFSDPTGAPLTGLDPGASGAIEFPGFPALPVATYEGDGFGGDGPGGRRVSLDGEGLVLGADGSFWVSDEYGPYVYRFSKEGRMVGAIRPPDAYVPQRNGSQSFSAASAPIYDPSRLPVPEDPASGRANNQGFEGLTLSPDGTTLSVLVQSALMQDGGAGGKKSRRHARLLQYDIAAPPITTSSRQPTPPKAEYVVPLPTFVNDDGETRVAAQSEMLALGPTQFLVLARDSGAGRAAKRTRSLYRHVDVFDVGKATDVVADDVDSVDGSVVTDAEKGVLADGVAPARYCAWLDFNVEGQLARFGLRNGGVDDGGLLNEKWESLAVVPVLAAPGGEVVEGEWFVISLSDNDFITQEGYMDGGRFEYKDETGASLDNQALVFRVGLERGLKPAGW
ncbi:hypothetical protein BK809_0003896 [Diplodia seriata]|uniref:Phytase-like domain-containing protein n=1 Tax=Diplodia seriata TaxID=420778 RepID=A0A1S8BCH5_9PEZI|nr:hypothetical protein BK809_0003896 [Diplodia seriata]